MTNKTKTESGGQPKRLLFIVTVVSLLLAFGHLAWPNLAIDGVTLALLLIAVVPWLQPIFRTLEFSGLGKVEFQELKRAAEDQVNVTLYQTIATVISWVQAEEIRESRRLLFEMEDSKAISERPAEEWKDEWKQAADRVSQAFNSAAIVVKQDERLQDAWVRPTRRAILKSWWIAKPRILERRKQAEDLWQEFDWLAERARESCKLDEEVAWTTGDAAKGSS